MKPDAPYQPSRALHAKVGRRIVQWRRAAPALAEPPRPIVSFTFDDFPKSAARGADIIEKLGGRAGFYASTSFMGGRSPAMGEMYDAAMLSDLHGRGHEIGAHTHAHIDVAKTRISQVERDIGENLVGLVSAGHVPTISAFAYPFGEATYAAKRWAGDVFSTARGVMPGINVGEIDRAQLRAVELGASGHRRKRAVAMLESCVATKGWLVFFTHDVSDAPSPFGAPAQLIRDLAQRALDMGCVLAPPTEAAYLAGVLE